MIKNKELTRIDNLISLNYLRFNIIQKLFKIIVIINNRLK